MGDYTIYDCDDIIESRFFNKLIGSADFLSTNSKLEIWYFVFDVIRLTHLECEIYMSYKIYDIILDLLQLNDNNAIEYILPIFYDIMEYANPPSLMVSLRYLLEKDFKEFFDDLDDNYSEQLMCTIIQFQSLINWFIEFEESEK